MRYQKIQLTGMFLLVLLVTGCAGPNVDWDYDTSAILTGMKSYAWLDQSEEVKEKAYQLDGLMDKRVRKAVDQELKAKGFKMVDNPGQADFLVSYFTAVKTRRNEEHITTSMGYGFNTWGMGLRSETRVTEYEEGSLVIDIIDPKSRELTWRGRSRSRVIDKATPGERTEKINRAVSAILEGFPPKEREKQ